MEKSMPSNDTQAPSPAPVNAKESNAVSIFILNELESQRCEFWVGLFAKGPHNPSQLFYKGSILEAFEVAGKDGLAEGVPIMLSDSTTPPVKYIYLLPPLGEDPVNDEDWVSNILQAVNAYKPKMVGIYLSQHAMQNPSKASHSLHQLMKELLQGAVVNTIALYPGDYGTNSVLNVALKIKNTYQTKGKPIVVYH